MSDVSTQAAGTTTNTGSAQPDAATAAATTTAAAPAAAVAAAAAVPASQSQQATDGQPAAAAKPADSTTGQAPPQGAPEKYEFKAPEGVVLDTDVVTEFSAMAKKLNLSQDAAQEVINQLAPKFQAGTAKGIAAAMEATVTKWADQAKADKEFGGEKLTENLAVAKVALERYGTPELRELLGTYHPTTNPRGTGLGNHPDLIRLFFRVGKAISEDRVVPGTTDPGKGARDAASVLYGPKP